MDDFPRLGEWADYLRWRSRFLAILDNRLYPDIWLDHQIATRQFILILVDEAAILVSVKKYPSGVMELQGEAATGKREAIVSTLIPFAERLAKQAGCSLASIQSRRGWVRIMRKFGYTLHQTTIRKAL